MVGLLSTVEPSSLLEQTFGFTSATSPVSRGHFIHRKTVSRFTYAELAHICSFLIGMFRVKSN